MSRPRGEKYIELPFDCGDGIKDRLAPFCAAPETSSRVGQWLWSTLCPNLQTNLGAHCPDEKQYHLSR